MSKANSSQFKLETDLISLRSLVAIVEEGSFSAAAKRINRTQSAISLQIAKLEERLNAKLLERTSRTIVLTPAGETFVSYARRILELADEAVLAVTAPEEATLLRVGFAEYLVPEHLHTLLARFRRAHPNCDLSLILGTGTPMLEALERGELDIVFCGPDGENGQVLWEEPLVWTGNGEALQKENASVDLVLMHPPCSYRQVAFEALTKAARPWKVSIDANSVQAVQSAIRAGLGISILPISAIHKDMPVPDADLPKLPNTSVVSYQRADSTHPYAQRFVDFLLACIEDSVETREYITFKHNRQQPVKLAS
ncbi:LysR family transcriptional regulator [Pseudovibrio flavus]|uniref:LysR family transcriptional regulator n=1 Tax=Pseudovibrio flavus TaxID=2529854 RepID=UPI00211B9586|nr:LysR family transcriptional regulator [Pseudovibrio flavus]